MQKLAAFFLLLATIPMLVYIISPSSKKQVLSDKTVVPSPTKQPVLTLTPVPNTAIAQAVDAVLKKRDGEYGIYYKNLATGEIYQKNPHERSRCVRLTADIFDITAGLEPNLARIRL